MFRNLSIFAALAACLISAPVMAADKVHYVFVESITVAGADVDVSSMANLVGLYSETTKSNEGNVFTRIRQTTKAGTKNLVLQAVDQMRGKVGKNDVVLFYYSGHGAIDNQGPFLQLDNDERLHRTELIQKMRGVGGRLHLLITDCCAVEVPPRIGTRAGANFIRPNAEQTQRVVDNFTRLFRASGVVDMNASSPKQVAWGTTGGGIFTKAFVKILHDNNVADWNSLHRTVKEQTEQEYAKFRTDGLSDGGQRLKLSPEDVAQLQDQNKQTPHLFQLALGGGDGPRPQGNGNSGNGGGPMKPPVVGGNTNPPGVDDDGPPMRPPVKPPLKTNGVVVTRVFPETAATALDLQGETVQLDRGDRILAVNGVAVQSAQQFYGLIDKMPKESSFTLKVVDRRTGKSVEVTGKLDGGGGFRFGAAVDD